MKKSPTQSNFWSPWVRALAWRFLRAKRAAKMLSLITSLSVIGIGLGVAVVITVLSVMDGFEEQLKSRLYSSEVHLQFRDGANPGDAFPENRYLESALRGWVQSPAGRAKGVEETRVFSTDVVLKSERRAKGVSLKGVDPERWERINAKLTDRASADRLWAKQEDGSKIFLPRIRIGKELADNLLLIPGDVVQLISPVVREGPMMAFPRMRTFVIEGIYQSGLPEQELTTVFTDLKMAQSFADAKGSLTQVEFLTSDLDLAPGLKKEMLSFDLGKFEAKDWTELNASLFFSLHLERFAMFVAMTFIIVVASFNILSSLAMLVLEKKREISILRVMGMTKRQAGSIFVLQGLFIGGVGVGGGVLLALMATGFLKRFQIIELPDIYYDRTLPVNFVPEYYVMVALTAFFIVLAASWVPAKRAAAIEPIEGIRRS